MKKIIAGFWRLFKSTPIGKVIRFIVSQKMVNSLEHFPVAVLANLIYRFPSRKITIIGVTGTDGKTTTTNMIYKCLSDAGYKTSMVSTINAVLGDKTYDTGFHVTSPHPFTVQEFIRKAVKAGSKYLVLEVTSHGLDQYRFWGTKFHVGVITNITHEHLDYHKTFSNYLKTKAKLLTGVKIVVLNYDDPSYKNLLKFTKGKKVFTFGKHKKADFRPGKYALKLKIPGEYNVFNAMAAMAVANNLGISEQTIKRSLESFTGLSGRMEEIKNNRGVKIVVDFAHTPNALQQALTALRFKTKGRLISVFGCAGARDIGKRSMMGQISAQLADITVLTDEDPRFEDRQKIIEQIIGGMDKERAILDKTLFVESDRQRAIEMAIKLAERGDTVGIFGKGHERSMNYQGVETLWSDQQAVLTILKK